MMTGYSVRRLRDLRKYVGRDWGRDENGLDLEGERVAEDVEHWESLARPARGSKDRRLRSRPEAVAFWLEHEAEIAGMTLADLVETVRPGRIPQAERERYDFLARCVAHLRDQGVALEAIGGAIAKPRRTVARLEERGRSVRLSETVTEVSDSPISEGL